MEMEQDRRNMGTRFSGSASLSFAQALHKRDPRWQTGPMADLVIRPLLAAEIPQLRDLAEETFREAFAHALRGPALELLLIGRFTKAKFEALHDDPEGWLRVAEEGGRLVGYAQAQPAPCPVQGPGEMPDWELGRLYVRQSHHGLGPGQALMQACVDAAQAAGARGLWLKVWEDNPRGRAFYRRWGFVEVGREDMDLYGTVLVHLILVKAW